MDLEKISVAAGAIETDVAELTRIQLEIDRWDRQQNILIDRIEKNRKTIRQELKPLGILEEETPE